MINTELLEFKKFTYDDLYKVLPNKKVVIFGASLNLAEIFKCKKFSEITVSYIVDNDKSKWGGDVNGIPIRPVDTLNEELKTELVVLIAPAFLTTIRHIKPQLQSMGIYAFYSIASMQARENERLGLKPSYKTIEKYENLASSLDLKSFLTKGLTGTGVEFGAGTTPFPVPIGCRVQYADLFSHGEGEFYTSDHSENFEVPITYKTSIDKMEGIQENSLDFILASHVIEHTRSPFAVFESGYKRLKPGGKMILIVPNMMTFNDKLRELTTLEHIDLDYKQPSTERDFLHYIESILFKKTFNLGNLFDIIKETYENQGDCHFHTFTYESFGAIVDYFSRTYYPFEKIESFPPLKSRKAIDFCFILTK